MLLEDRYLQDAGQSIFYTQCCLEIIASDIAQHLATFKVQMMYSVHCNTVHCRLNILAILKVLYSVHCTMLLKDTCRVLYVHSVYFTMSLEDTFRVLYSVHFTFYNVAWRYFSSVCIHCSHSLKIFYPLHLMKHGLRIKLEEKENNKCLWETIITLLLKDPELHKHPTKDQSWALALYFQVRSPLSAHFISMDCYRSSAHFANFQVRSSLNCLQKDQWFAPKKTVVRSRSKAVNRLLLCSLGWYS